MIRLTSSQQLDIDLAGGRYYFGSLIESSADGELRIKTGAGELDVKLADVVNIAPIKGSFWKRLEADVTAGLSFTKSSDILQFNLGSSATYRTLKAYTDITLNTIITSKSKDESKTNTDILHRLRSRKIGTVTLGLSFRLDRSDVLVRRSDDFVDHLEESISLSVDLTGIFFETLHG